MTETPPQDSPQKQTAQKAGIPQSTFSAAPKPESSHAGHAKPIPPQQPTQPVQPDAKAAGYAGHPDIPKKGPGKVESGKPSSPDISKTAVTVATPAKPQGKSQEKPQEKSQENSQAQTPVAAESAIQKKAQKDTPKKQADKKLKQKSKKGKKDDQPSEGAAPINALASVVTRNEYYRDGYRTLMKIALIEGIVIVGLLAAFVVYMNVHQERNRYFATTADGRILQLTALDQPNISSAALMSWVSQSATEVMTFGFHDYQRRLQDASRHFTRRGWESFTTALQRSRIIESVEQLQQVVTAAPRSAPVLLQEGVFNGRYRWVVRLPLAVTFKSGSKATTSNLNVTITIERVPTLESPNGVGIESWIAV